MLKRIVALVMIATVHLVAAAPSGNAHADAKELAGLWQAKLRYGPDVRGALKIENSGPNWRADIAGRATSVRVVGDTVTFELQGGLGSFIGRFKENRAAIVGHWIQPGTPTFGPTASPCVLQRVVDGRWRGEVAPIDAQFTMYLKVTPRPNGTVSAFLKNPERNVGRFIRVDQIELDGSTVRLRAADANGAKGRVLSEGTYRDNIMSLPLRGGTYDFVRVDPDSLTDFYPRGRPSVPYIYTPPPQRDDGWPTARLEDVGVSRDSISRFVQKLIDERIDSLSAPEVHSVLIARHGKLVLEEYFHGEHRDKPHATRSAAKSLTATLAGVAIQAGYPLSVTTPVWQTMLGGRLPADLDARKRGITLEHLLMMASGLDCDDADQASPGREDYVTDEQPDRDWYRYIMSLKVIRDPGEPAIYCSINPHLAGGVIARATKRSLPELFQDLIAEPLKIVRYGMPITPTGDAYMGGGVRLTSRDFMKLGQLMLNDGMWESRRALPKGWSAQASAPHVTIQGRKYGYLWWIADYPYKGRTVRAYAALGNGGQVTMVIAELDLVVTFNSGNYSDRTTFIMQNEYVPKYVLPAVN